MIINCSLHYCFPPRALTYSEFFGTFIVPKSTCICIPIGSSSTASYSHSLVVFGISCFCRSIRIYRLNVLSEKGKVLNFLPANHILALLIYRENPLTNTGYIPQMVRAFCYVLACHIIIH